MNETHSAHQASPEFRLQLTSRCDDPPCAQDYDLEHRWHWADGESPPPPRADSPPYQFALTTAQIVAESLASLKLTHSNWAKAWSRPVSRKFVDDFLDWHANLPPGTIVEITPELRGLVDGPVHARVYTQIDPDNASDLDWFDVTVELDTGELTFTSDALRLLLRAQGGWVRLPQRGWQRLHIDLNESEDDISLGDLGLAITPEDLLQPKTQRYHALQLSNVKLEDEALSRRLAERVATLHSVPPPPPPPGLQANL
ncbi:MAG: hypothetical protein J6386_02375 [Candidatus Synoicihabitans palmerolidicus]|nr:hypothetical protein [Candidatus Synoicihabitans palmerolidicus]